MLFILLENLEILAGTTFASTSAFNTTMTS
jgi:hypothetical protein